MAASPKPQVDEEFERWMQRREQDNFFTNNAITLTVFGALGGATPIVVNLLQLRPAYRRK